MYHGNKDFNNNLYMVAITRENSKCILVGMGDREREADYNCDAWMIYV